MGTPNPRRPRRYSCKVCKSPDVARVDAFLRAGESIRNVVAQTGFSRSSVDRHNRYCLVPAIAHASHMVESAALLVAESAGAPSDVTSPFSAILPADTRAGIVRKTLAGVRDSAKMPLLKRVFAAIADADELRAGLQLLLTEAMQVYHDTDADKIGLRIQALRQATYIAVVLGKAHGWIQQETIVEQRNVNVFGDLNVDDMRALQTMLAPIVSSETNSMKTIVASETVTNHNEPAEGVS